MHYKPKLLLLYYDPSMSIYLSKFEISNDFLTAGLGVLRDNAPFSFVAHLFSINSKPNAEESKNSVRLQSTSNISSSTRSILPSSFQSTFVMPGESTSNRRNSDKFFLICLPWFLTICAKRLFSCCK